MNASARVLLVGDDRAAVATAASRCEASPLVETVVEATAAEAPETLAAETFDAVFYVDNTSTAALGQFLDCDGDDVSAATSAAQRSTSDKLESSIREHEAISQLAAHAITEQDLDALFDEAVTVVAEVLDNEYCKVLELQPEREELLLRSGVGWKDGYVGTATVDSQEESQAGYTLLSEKPVVVADLAEETRFSGPDLLVEHGVVSGISVIIGPAEEPWGILGTHDTRVRDFGRHDVEFVASVSHILHSAIGRMDREAALHRQNERLERVASVLSHDLRNPLTVAMLNLEVLAEETGEEQVDAIERIERSHDRMSVLIEDVLTLARREKRVVASDTIDLAAIATRAWETVSTGQASLVVDTETTIYASETDLQSLFENLYRNAVEHAGLAVTVHVGDLEDEAGFYVADDGPGIPEENREEVFDPGFSTQRDGSGFGLHIVERVATAHDWDVSVTAAANGGARFEFGGVETVESSDSETQTSA
ncbi:sensor histidine kinase [Haloarchaeobius sp. DFWS5]|uniref:sensor histidine kinase n=1 Tax=Haloarchaeobius sp. DFWS5 TaxID=3446114 RepID=UPI003EBE6826